MPKNFLLVDDDIDDIELLREGLSSVDETIICAEAANGFDALDALESKPLPDLIFLDINMPKMDGWECLKVLKSNPAYNDVPVLMYSTSSNQKDISTASDLGAWGFYTKPDDFKSLKQKLRIIIDFFEKSDVNPKKYRNFNNITT